MQGNPQTQQGPLEGLSPWRMRATGRATQWSSQPVSSASHQAAREGEECSDPSGDINLPEAEVEQRACLDSGLESSRPAIIPSTRTRRTSVEPVSMEQEEGRQRSESGEFLEEVDSRGNAPLLPPEPEQSAPGDALTDVCHSAVQPQPQSQRPPFRCRQEGCPSKGYQQLADLRRHLRRVHHMDKYQAIQAGGGWVCFQHSVSRLLSSAAVLPLSRQTIIPHSLL